MSEQEFPMSNSIPKEHLDAMREAARGNWPSDAERLTWRADAALKPAYRIDGGSWRADAAESFFVARQLEFMRPGIYAVQYPALKAQRLIPFNTGIDTGAGQYTATVVDQVGTVTVMADESDDINMVDLKTQQVSTPLYTMSLGYQYSIQEARAAMFARVPLIPQKALRCREQLERRLDDIAFLGDGSPALATPMVGLLSASGTDTYTVPTTGSGSSTLWSTKSSDDVLADLNGAPNQVIVNTKEIEIPNTLVLPLSLKTLISNRRVGDGTSLTILKYFMENQEYVKEVEGTYKAELAGDSDSDNDGDATRAVWYVKDPTRLEMLVSQPFEQLPPEARGQMVRTICRMRTGGLAVYLPKSMIYADNI